MNVIITGATGMIGKGLLLECLDDQRVGSIILVTRNSVGVVHEKIKEVILKDFNNPESISHELTGYDAVFFCLGVSAGGMNEALYSKITYDYTINFAKAYLSKNPNGQFIYVSGKGTDSTEKGRMMWARVKGKTENELLKMPFQKAYMFRPGIIRPLKGIKSRTPLYRFLYIIITLFWPLFKWMMGKNLTDTTRIGKAMINVIAFGSEKKYFENKDINLLAEASQ